MGMFDTVVVEGLKLPTPGKEVAKYLKEINLELPNDYQTKDLDNSLSTYIIDSKGQLWCNEMRATGKKIAREPFTAFVDSRSFLERLYINIKFKKFSSKETNLWPEFKTVKTKSHYTGEINFYNYAELQGRYVDVEYVGTFINGKVKSIKLVKGELEAVTAAKKRKNRDEAFFNKLKEDNARRAEFTSKWYYPVLRETYNPLIFFLKLFVQWSCTKIATWSYKWHGV